MILKYINQETFLSRVLYWFLSQMCHDYMEILSERQFQFALVGSMENMNLNQLMDTGATDPRSQRLSLKWDCTPGIVLCSSSPHEPNVHSTDSVCLLNTRDIS